MEEEKIEQRKKRIKNWLKNPENFLLVLVLLFAFVIRFYYFWTLRNQPLWWDAACYGALAQNYAHHLWDSNPLIIGETLIRPQLFPYIWSILLKLGFNEVAVRFFLEFLPSFIAVFFVYLIQYKDLLLVKFLKQPPKPIYFLSSNLFHYSFPLYFYLIVLQQNYKTLI